MAEATIGSTLTLYSVLGEVATERRDQDAKWGEQNHPDGTDPERVTLIAGSLAARASCQDAARDGKVTWRHILTEEIAEAYEVTDPAKLRGELVQIAAVACAWVEAIDRRSPQPARAGGEESEHA